jgi:hypothetical protein
VAHAQAERAFPQSPTYPVAAVAAAVAAILVAATLAFTALDPFGSERPLAGSPNQALLDAEARWELHRKLQSGDIDARTRAEREWELHRKLQSGAFE